MLFGGVGCKVVGGKGTVPFNAGVVVGGILADCLRDATKGEVSAAAETGPSPASSGAGT